MKLKLLLIVLFFTLKGWSQPVIAGDTMLCPFSNGTAYVTNDIEFDSYTWYWKYWFSDEEFQLVPFQAQSSFTYDWYTYDQALIKCVVTLNGETFESNTIQIDSYAWVGLTTGFMDSENISIDPNNGNIMLCEGTTFTANVYMPYTIVQWYRDGIAIPGANSMSLEINGPGTYHVVASPDFCPDNTSSSEGTALIVVNDPDCQLGTDNPSIIAFDLYPNPASGQTTVVASSIIKNVSIYTMTGQLIRNLEVNATRADINLDGLATGMYIIKSSGDDGTQIQKLIKQ